MGFRGRAQGPAPPIRVEGRLYDYGRGTGTTTGGLWCNAFSLSNIDHTKFLSTMQWFIYCYDISMLRGSRLAVPVIQNNIHITRMFP